MKKGFKIYLLGFYVLTASFSVQAGDFNYNYVDILYDDVDVNIGGVVSLDGDGFNARGSFEVAEKFFVTASYSSWELDSVVDVDMWEIGGGYHHPLEEKTDLLFGFTTGNTELSAVTSIDIDTWSAYTGVRHQLTDKFEIGGRVTYIDYDGNDSDTRFGINGLYSFSNKMAVIVSFDSGDEIDTLSAGVRFNF